jgi:Wiskott-Aldrich syndrome protein
MDLMSWLDRLLRWLRDPPGAAAPAEPELPPKRGPYREPADDVPLPAAPAPPPPPPDTSDVMPGGSHDPWNPFEAPPTPRPLPSPPPGTGWGAPRPYPRPPTPGPGEGRLLRRGHARMTIG